MTHSPKPVLAVGKYAALLAYLSFALFPLYWLLKIAVTPDQLIYTEGTNLWPSEFTFDNFRSVVFQTDFLSYFGNSLYVSLGTAAVTTLVAAGAGYAFSRFNFAGKRLLIAVMLITQMFPLLMIIAPIYKIIAGLGMLNSLTSLIVVYTAFNVPFATFLMQSFFDGIPKDLEEAAMMDGCSRFQALYKVIFPLTLPGLGATLGFVFTAAWSELLFALMLISKNEAMTFPVGLLTFVSKFSVDWGQMMAAGVLALVPSCLFFIFIQRYLVQGLTSGAVKG
ncbi:MULTISPECIES: carbohydrate ABC transporter permease [Halocynthiibacter]|uniref:Carbohydrate ABC transporter permease n=2 Tax=Halocynthiibacter TaxID=1579315 RepID=A0AAE3IVM1_9RHOB|nr:MULTISPECIES: carbohydrate ABC transporter permease [Halocynthiibacter]MCV6822970.1 carbohydrate ABC transporter permease [Halocynthiibacter halioticoli]MCW4055971.1 carbohydrate ABC transporter permease [Halocynthiibacter sp. SDUM655004]MDE0591459.1 carbohydrate ABC transporter permease [Halocynthiibacter sp. C4]